MLPKISSINLLGLSAAISLGMASGTSQAALTVHVRAVDTTNGGTVYTTSGSPNSFDLFSATGTAGDFTVSVSSEAVEGTPSSLLSTNTIDILNGTATVQSTLRLFVSVTGFNQPGVANEVMSISSSASGTSASFTSGQFAQLQSYADPTNATITDLPIPGSAVSPGAQTGIIFSGSGTANYNFTTTTNLGTTFIRNGGHYSLTHVFEVTLNPGRRANLTLSTSVEGTGNIVPEPSTIALALSAMPLLGVVGFRRWNRRNKND